MGLLIATPNMLQKLPATNSPSIRPKKNGMALRCIFNPPAFRMMDFAAQLRKIENQKQPIAQPADTA